MMAMLNNLDVHGGDTQAESGFGPEEGKWFTVVSAFCVHMTEKRDNAGFESSVADPDAWMRPATTK